MIKGVTVKLDKGAVKARVNTDMKQGVKEISNEFLKDSNYFVREDSSELQKSAIRASDPDNGILVWDTPYAKRVFYTGTPSKDKNPNASLMWCEKAKDKNKGKYKRMFQAIINRHKGV